MSNPHHHRNRMSSSSMLIISLLYLLVCGFLFLCAFNGKQSTPAATAPNVKTPTQKSKTRKGIQKTGGSSEKVGGNKATGGGGSGGRAKTEEDVIKKSLYKSINEIRDEIAELQVIKASRPKTKQ